MPLKSTWTFGLDNEYHRENLMTDFDFTNHYNLMSNNNLFQRKIRYEQPTSPTDRVGKLADWFQTCTLDENKPENYQSINNSLSQTNPFFLSSLSTKSNDRQSSKNFSSFIIFFLGLVLGYFLTNIFPPHVLYQWILIVQQISIQITKESFHFLINYLQIFLKNFPSYNRVI